MVGSKLEVLFIAHENALSPDRNLLELGIPCDIRVTTFPEACGEVIEMAAAFPDQAKEVFNRWVVQPLDAPNTPQPVKRKALEMFES